MLGICHDLRSCLKAGTDSQHKELDSLFQSLDLTDRHGFAVFVAAHLIGWRAAWQVWSSFAADRLEMTLLDYPAMMSADLADLGFDAARLPKLALAENGLCADGVHRAAGIAYVLAGSRMGISAIRRQPNWGTDHGRADTYLSDDSGGRFFRALLDWMNGPEGHAIDRDRALDAARGTFGLFRAALEQARKALH